MKTKQEMVEEWLGSVGLNYHPVFISTARESYLAGFEAAEKIYEERIKSLEEKLEIATDCLVMIDLGCISPRVSAHNALSKIRGE